MEIYNSTAELKKIDWEVDAYIRLSCAVIEQAKKDLLNYVENLEEEEASFNTDMNQLQREMEETTDPKTERMITLRMGYRKRQHSASINLYTSNIEEVRRFFLSETFQVLCLGVADGEVAWNDIWRKITDGRREEFREPREAVLHK